MIKLNKIVNLMVIAGVVNYSSAAFAADLQVSQDTQFTNQTTVSQQTDTDQTSANSTNESDSAAQSNSDVQANTNGQANTDSNAEQQQAGSTADESTDVAITKMSKLKGYLVANSTNSVASSLTQSTSVIATNSLATVSQLQLPAMFETETSEPISDPDDVQETTPSEMSDAPEFSNSVDLDNTTGFASSLSANAEQLVSFDVASQANQVIEQSVNTSITDSIASNAESSVVQTMNSQIDTLVAEQINTEVANATATEVANTITSDLGLGI
jgi:hypothetical protein